MPKAFILDASRAMNEVGVLQNIMKHIPVVEVLNISRVSRTWRKATENLTFHPADFSLYLSNGEAELGTFQAGEHHEFLINKIHPTRKISIWKEITSLEIEDCDNLMSLLESMPYLARLEKISFDEQLTPSIFQKLSSKCDISNITIVSIQDGTDMEDFISVFTNLEKLQLWPSFDSFGWRTDFSKLPRLKCLEVIIQQPLPHLQGKVHTLRLSFVHAYEYGELVAFDVPNIGGVERLVVEVDFEYHVNISDLFKEISEKINISSAELKEVIIESDEKKKLPSEAQNYSFEDILGWTCARDALQIKLRRS